MTTVREGRRATEDGLRVATAVLSAAGIGVAGYLTYVHYAGIDPVCAGGSHGCAIVQASDQSKLAGVPVALLGLIGYVVLLATSLVRSELATIAAALTALVGFGFSSYLTYESIHVINATCQWCLASAALMTALAVVCTARLLRSA